MKNILTIVGARPQFVKAAVVSKAIADVGIKEMIIHTGQHYDHEMSTIFWDELDIPTPSINLGIGSGLHGKQTGLMMEKIEAYLLEINKLPDALLVYGDTNSTIAGALVASKLHIPVIHVEAGLRSFNRQMPEEINRILTDHVSTILFCSSQAGVDQLKSEGISRNVHNVGDVMYDALLTFSNIANTKFKLHDVVPDLHSEYYLATIHRPSNTDDSHNLKSIIRGLSKLDKPVVWPVHPRNRSKIETLKLPENLITINPVSYFKMLILLANCSKVITDSGGLQKEAYWMKKQCITVRNETEWVETLHGGWNTLTGPNSEKIKAAVSKKPDSDWQPLYGDGKAAQRIADTIKSSFDG